MKILFFFEKTDRINSFNNLKTETACVILKRKEDGFKILRGAINQNTLLKNEDFTLTNYFGRPIKFPYYQFSDTYFCIKNINGTYSFYNLKYITNGNLHSSVKLSNQELRINTIPINSLLIKKHEEELETTNLTEELEKSVLSIGIIDKIINQYTKKESSIDLRNISEEEKIIEKANDLKLLIKEINNIYKSQIDPEMLLEELLTLKENMIRTIGGSCIFIYYYYRLKSIINQYTEYVRE